ncbi:hypothetical protein AC1031_016951 [Aphanomyces cochlioides]|nr:hypothetical protein AC1031_016951 [Aphanomyces cochlioides]
MHQEKLDHFVFFVARNKQENGVMGNVHAQIGRVGTIGRHTVEVTKYLGEGGSSFIFLVKDTSSSQTLVLKRLVANDAMYMELLKNEIEFHRRFKYPSIVEFVDSQINKSRSEQEVFILMEFCPGGHLYDNMKKMGEKRFTLEELIKTFRSLCMPVQYLHRQEPPIAHRDIKLENFLLAKSGVYKLCDFGSCVEGPRVLTTKEDRTTEIDVVEKRTTAMYRSPELADIEGTAMFGNGVLTEAVDIWALGCVLYTMAFFKPPFPPEGLRTSKYTIPSGHSYGKDVPALIQRMLCEDVEERANIDEVIACCDAILGSQPLPKRGSVAKSTSRPNSGSNSRTNSGEKGNIVVDEAKPSRVNSGKAVDLLNVSAPAAPVAPVTSATFADFADFSKSSFDPFAAQPAPPPATSKVVDSFGFLVSPTNNSSVKQTEARDVFQAFEECNQPKLMPWQATPQQNVPGGYPAQGGYPGQGGYPAQSGYHAQGGYPAQGAYPPQGQPSMGGFQAFSPMSPQGNYPPSQFGGFPQGNANPISPMAMHNMQSPPSNSSWKSSYEFKF